MVGLSQEEFDYLLVFGEFKLFLVLRIDGIEEDLLANTNAELLLAVLDEESG